MSFCKIPFHGLNLRNDGTIRTCCSSIGQMSGIRDNTDTPINITDTDSLNKAFNSDELKKLRLAMLSNDNTGYKNHCKHCIHQESLGINSVRTKHNKFYRDSEPIVLKDGSMSIKDLKMLDVRLDTICDQACIMCGPYSSTMWEKEIKKDINKWSGKVADEYHWVQKFNKNTLTPEHLFEQLPNLNQIEFRGGEPLVDKKVINLLDYMIEKGYSKNIYLSFVTNTQSASKDVVNKMKQFKGGIIRCSVDAIGKKNEYHRYHSNWKKIEQGLTNLAELVPAEENKLSTLERFKDRWLLIILPTMTTYNALQWKEYFEYFDNFFEKNNMRALIALNSIKDRPEMFHTIIDHNIRLAQASELEKLKGKLKMHKWDDGFGKRNISYFTKLIKAVSRPQEKNSKELVEKFLEWCYTIEVNREQPVYDYFPELKVLENQRK